MPSPARTSPPARATLVALLALVALGAAALAAYAASRAGSLRHARSRIVIRGDVRPALTPGATRPVNLVISNPYPFAVLIARVRITLAVVPRVGTHGCTVRRDFTVRQLPRQAYPLRMTRSSRARLSRLRVRPAYLPRIGMRDLRTVNQDGCKGARLHLHYTLLARRARSAR